MLPKPLSASSGGVHVPAWRALLLAFVAGALVSADARAGRVLRPGTAGTPAPGHSVTAAAAVPGAATTLARLPLQFEANRGQMDARVRFLSRGSGYTVLLTDTEAVLSLRGSEKPQVQSEKRKADRRPVAALPGGRQDPRARQIENRKSKIENHVLRMRLVGAAGRPRVDALERLPGIVNYFVGRDPKKWRTRIPTYARVRFRGVYTGVDLVYYGNQGRLEYDFVVAPGADPKQIRLAFQGADKTVVDAAGDLVLRAGGQEVRFHKPRVYQEINGRRVAVAAGWALDEGFRVQGSGLRAARADRKSKIENRKSASFALARYDRRRPLVIDPVLSYSTYLGATGHSEAYALAADAAGCAYVVGVAYNNFPTTPGAFQPNYTPSTSDGYVAKLNASGTALLYATYLGGYDLDEALAITVDASGCAYVAGYTYANDFPTTPGAFQTDAPDNRDSTEGFAVKLNASGSALLYSTYLAGHEQDEAFAIAVDAAGCAYVAGFTRANDFPTTLGAIQRTHGGGYRDVFALKLNASASDLLWSTLLGGSEMDEAFGVAVDAAGCAYLTGRTYSPNFPTTPGALRTTHGGYADAFVAKLNATGTGLIYSTYLGGGGEEWAYAIAVDAAGCAYVAGDLRSGIFPTTPGAFQTTEGGNANDAFLSKLNPAGSAFVYSTRFGRNGDDAALGVAVDAAGNAWIAGRTCSTTLPTTPDAVQSTVGGVDGFVSQFNATGSRLLYSTYLGGSDWDEARGLALDAAGRVYVAGLTWSSDFPTTPGALTTTVGQGYETFVTKFESPHLAFRVQPANARVGSAIAPAVQVAICRSDGSVASTATGAVTLALGANPGGGTLSGTLTVAAVAGVATFTDLAISRIGQGYTLVASADGVAGAASSAFDVTAGPPARLAFTGQPAGATAGAALAPAAQVAIQDADGNLVAGAVNTVTVEIGANPGGGTLSGTRSAVASGGRAVFPALSIDRPGTGYTLRATATGLSPATSSPFNITVGPAMRVAFTVQPRTTAAGAVIAPAVRVAVQDSCGNLVATAANTITLAIGDNPAGGTLSGARSAAAAAGIATFAGLSLDRAGRGYTLTAAAPGLGTATSATFDVIPAPAAKLAFMAQPPYAAAGSTLMPAVKVAVQDALGNTVTTSLASVTLAIGTNPGGGSLSGTTTAAAVAGVATFAGLKVSRAGNGYTLVASTSGLTGATSSPFNIGPPDTTPTLAGQPDRTGAEGAAVSVALAGAADADGDPLAWSATGLPPGISLNAATGAITGRLPYTAAAGSPYSVTITVTDNTPGGPGGDSASRTFTWRVTNTDTTPTLAALSGRTDAEGTAVSIAIAGAADADGDTLAWSATGLPPGLSLNAATGAITGTLPYTAAAASPYSVMVGITDNTPGGPGGDSASRTFTWRVTNTDTKPALAVLADRTDAEGSAIQFSAGGSDADGDRLTYAAAPLPPGVAIRPATGAISGTLSHTAAGRYRVAVTVADSTPGGPAGDTDTRTFLWTVANSPAARLEFTTRPGDTVAGGAFAVVVAARDARGQTDTGFRASVSLGITAGPTGARLLGTTYVAAVAGVATFTVSLQKAGAYTLTATSGALSVESASFRISPGAADRLLFVQQPTNAPAGAAITPAVRVTVQDRLGNTVPSAAGAIALALGGGPQGAVLGGTTTATPVGGVATFGKLVLQRAGTGYRLTAGSPGLTPATSTAFSIAAGPAARLAFAALPGTVTAGAAFTVKVEVRDARGNRVPVSGTVVTLAPATAPAGAALGGVSSVPTAAGVATFAGLTLATAGTYTLAATAPGLPAVRSAVLQVAAGPTAKVTFVTQPRDTAAGAAFSPPVQVAVQDRLGNPVRGASGTVTVALYANSAGGNLEGTRAVPVSGGLATFRDLKIRKAGSGYALRATFGTRAVTSTAFGILPGPARTLAFTTQPGRAAALSLLRPAVVVTVQDLYGNRVPGATASVTLRLQPPAGASGAVLYGSDTVAAVAGAATFADLSIDKAAAGYALRATGGGLAGATSRKFDVTPGPAAWLAFTQVPATVGAGVAFSVKVIVQDDAGNTVPTATPTVTLSLGTNPSGAVLSGTRTTRAAAGVALFPAVSIDRPGGEYTLKARASGLPETESPPIWVTGG